MKRQDAIVDRQVSWSGRIHDDRYRRSFQLIEPDTRPDTMPARGPTILTLSSSSPGLQHWFEHRVLCVSPMSPCRAFLCAVFVCCLVCVCLVCVRSAVFGIVPEVLRILANWVSFESSRSLDATVARVRIHTT